MEGRLLTWMQCSSRVLDAISSVSELIDRAAVLGIQVTLADVLQAVEILIERKRLKPCVYFKNVEEYLPFLAEQLDGLTRAVLNVGMEAVSRHLDRLGFNAYALLSAVMIGYSLTEVQLVSSFRQVLYELTVDEVEHYEPLVFASVLRFMAYAHLLSSIRPKKLLSRIKSLVGLAETFTSEDQEVASTFTVSTGLRGGVLG